MSSFDGENKYNFTFRKVRGLLLAACRPHFVNVWKNAQ